ncbi:MAG: hypothetical protein MZV65_54245 [Chromatiales bacterium]|nr:hypothetical protein [Chromatiales bacterium]
MNYTRARSTRTTSCTRCGRSAPSATCRTRTSCSESGRALTAHHAVLITNVLDVRARARRSRRRPRAEAGEPQIIQDLWKVPADVSATRPPLEVYHDAAHWLGEAPDHVSHGVLSLEQRARAETALLRHLPRGCAAAAARHPRPPRGCSTSSTRSWPTSIFCNFSLFQSMPDRWAIDQIFPVLPLHAPRRAADRPRGAAGHHLRLGRTHRPVRRRPRASRRTLPLHALRAASPTTLASSWSAPIRRFSATCTTCSATPTRCMSRPTADGGFRLSQPLRGDTVDSVLRFVHFDAEDLLGDYRDKVAAAGWLSEAERATCLGELAAGLEGYTYLED